ncbi:MAG: phosphoribosyl-ATP diphosphatase [Halobacteriaceae archaeon]
MSGDEDILEELVEVIASRRDASPDDSYTAALLASEDRVLEKVGEETTELLLAAKNDDADEIVAECADLFYHVLVLLEHHDVEFEAVAAALRERRG